MTAGRTGLTLSGRLAGVIVLGAASTVQAWMGHASVATTNLYLHHLGTSTGSCPRGWPMSWGLLGS